MPVLSRNESLAIPQEALVLKRYFDIETEWDHPEKEIVGPIEVEIEFDEILGNDKLKTRAKVYRPIRQQLSDNVRPLVHCPESLWGYGLSCCCNQVWKRIFDTYGNELG